MQNSEFGKYNAADTIAAIATFPSRAALGVIKVSGKKAIEIVATIFIPKKKKKLRAVKSFSLHYGWIKDRPGRKYTLLDEVLVSVMRGPYSYTREDVVEVSSHGGMVVLNAILKAILGQGARLAHPGEFSYRAFLNGRIDLIQAQAVNDIVHARTEKALFALSAQMRGDFSKEIFALEARLGQVVARLEAAVNFPEEEVAEADAGILEKLKKIEQQILAMVKESETGNIYREGIRCVICGRANVGKSTLFNRLIQQERAIVTNVPGTTRDVIEESVNIHGIPFCISDTAGIINPRDAIEEQAVEYSHKQLKNADVVLLVIDSTKGVTKKDQRLFSLLHGKNAILVVNKIDVSFRDSLTGFEPQRFPVVRVSALKNTGIEILKDRIAQSVRAGIDTIQHPLILARWQQDILKEVASGVSSALQSLGQGHPCDYVLFILNPVIKQLAKLTGKEVDEAVLNDIFSNFCIGK